MALPTLRATRFSGRTCGTRGRRQGSVPAVVGQGAGRGRCQHAAKYRWLRLCFGGHGCGHRAQ
eukprot:2076511-Alexandrium_andersonii.AAC.1